MHIWIDLLAREGTLLLTLLALGAAPAASLSEHFDAPGRLALAPILGFCLGTCLVTTVLEFIPVVREDIAPWTINVGAPTRVVGTRPSDVILAHALQLGFPQ